MDILFWSGGKDSYLALEFYKHDHSADHLKLLTTYEETSEMVPHQQIPLSHIQEQADRLKLELICVPLPRECSNNVYLERVRKYLLQQEKEIVHLVFGDWKLEDIREWREKEFGKMGYKCLFPIWKKSIHKLLPVLMLKPIKVKISAVDEKYNQYIRQGESYNPGFVRTLPRDIDPMGENGEFHTEVVFKELEKWV